MPRRIAGSLRSRGVKVTLRYKCSKCENWHEGLPDVGYSCPYYAHEIPDEERSKRVYLTSDLCIVDHEHFFIRCQLPVPIIGTPEQFVWGVWSTLSRENFRRYQEHYDEDMSGWPPMFGYLSNSIADYQQTLGLHLSVQTKARGMRPIATLEPTEHLLSVEQRDGISLEKVARIVEPFLHK